MEDISFEAKSGEVTALIGSTGSGKSTIVNLIPRLMDATKGRVTIDGIDVKDINLKDLRDNIGFVPQKKHFVFGYCGKQYRLRTGNAGRRRIGKIGGYSAGV